MKTTSFSFLILTCLYTNHCLILLNWYCITITVSPHVKMFFWFWKTISGHFGIVLLMSSCWYWVSQGVQVFVLSFYQRVMGLRNFRLQFFWWNSLFLFSIFNIYWMIMIGFVTTSFYICLAKETIIVISVKN